MSNNYPNTTDRNIAQAKNSALVVKIVACLMGCGIFFFGLIFALGGIFGYKQSQELKDKCTKTTTGEIVDYETKTSTHRTRHNGRTRTRTTTTYSAVVEYEVNGKTYTITRNVGSSSKPNIGKTIEVHYNPSKPSQAYAEGDVNVGKIFAVIGVVVAVVGLVIAISLPIIVTRTTNKRVKYQEYINQAAANQNAGNAQNANAYTPNSAPQYQQNYQPTSSTTAWNRKSQYDDDDNTLGPKYE